MSVSAAIANRCYDDLPASGFAPPATRAGLTTRLSDFATNCHE